MPRLHAIVTLSTSLIALGLSPVIILSQMEAGYSQNNPFQNPPSPSPGVGQPGSRVPTLNPENLNPSANPLIFPTNPSEVHIQRLQPLTLQQAIALARRNNRTLQTAILNLERTRAALQEALAAEYPTVGLTSTFANSDSPGSKLGNLRLPAGVRQPSTTSTTLDSTLALNYNLYTAGQRSATIRLQQEQVRYYELGVETQSEQTRLDVTNAYYDLQQADAQVEIDQASVREADRSLRDARLLEQSGLGTRFDILQAEVQLSNANQTLTRDIGQQRITRRQLVQLLSLAQNVEVEAADPIQEAGTWQLSLEQSIILAFRNRGELQQQLAQRNISKQQQIIDLAANKPQVSLFANYNLLDVYNDGFGPAGGLSLGARLQWNFFDAGAARARAAQAQSNVEIAENNFADSRNQIRYQVEQAYYNLTSSQQNINTAKVALNQATESLKLARLRFTSGVGTQTDVINAQSALTTARGNLLQAIITYNRGLASLQRAISNVASSPR